MTGLPAAGGSVRRDRRQSPPAAGSCGRDRRAVGEDLGELREPVCAGGFGGRERFAGAVEGDGAVPGGGDLEEGPGVVRFSRNRGRFPTPDRGSARTAVPPRPAEAPRAAAAIRAARLSALVWPSAIARAVVGHTCGCLPPPSFSASSSWRSLSSPGADSTNSSMTPPRTGWTWMLRMLVSSSASDRVIFFREPGWSRRMVRARHRDGRGAEPPPVPQRRGVEPARAGSVPRTAPPPRSPGRWP